MSSNTSTKKWAVLKDNEILLVRMTNENGNYIEFTNFGATLLSIFVPDRNGKRANVILRYDTFSAYLNDPYYMGSTIGRTANRISNGCFPLDGNIYYVEKNDGAHSNHGGYSGFHKRVFDVKMIGDEVLMSLVDDESGGYPGNLNFQVCYRWTDSNQLMIRYNAFADKKTLANFTNHTYFNLSGGYENILKSDLRVDSDQYLENDNAHVPTGNIITDPDKFSGSRRLGDLIEKHRPIETGLNRYFIFSTMQPFKPQVEFKNPFSGRRLKICTSYPGIMIYTGQYLDPGKNAARSDIHPLNGICLECQHYPDSLNHQNFPQSALAVGVQYEEVIEYRFDVF